MLCGVWLNQNKGFYFSLRFLPILRNQMVRGLRYLVISGFNPRYSDDLVMQKPFLYNCYLRAIIHLLILYSQLSINFK